MNKQKIIVSLTSFPAAIPYAVQAIRSILAGSLLPDKIVLYLTFSQFGEDEIPEELKDLADRNPIFEIRNYEQDIRSYRKLIPALKDFPDDVIVTVDDDIHYDKDMLKGLVKTHMRVPEAVVAHRVRHIRLDKPYSKWRKYKWYDFLFKRIRLSYLAMQTGAGGVLYPPHSLDEKMLDPKLFMQLAPTTDDVWFWAAAVSRGNFVVPVPFGKTTAPEVGKPAELSLKTVNLQKGNDRNRKALDTMLAHFPEIRSRLQKH